MSCAGVGVAARGDEANPVIRDHRIGFVETGLHWSVYQTGDGSKECPKGFNTRGPREAFKGLYPNGGPVADTELVREALKAFPQDMPAQLPYLEVQSNIAIGLNLDGKVGLGDFTSPDGEQGIDNAFYRVTGCHPAFRDGGIMAGSGRYLLTIPSFAFMRMMIEISGVDSLQNDDNVDVTIYRGRDSEVLDSSGNKVVPGGSERIDLRYGKKLIQHLHGKIENGVLLTDPIKDGSWPWTLMPNVPRVLRVHDMRLRLKLSPTNAEGLVAGYFDVDSIYHWMISWSTHHLGYGQLDAPELYWAIRRNADAYPDQNGVMTAISSALTVNMAQVFVIHPDEPENKQVGAAAMMPRSIALYAVSLLAAGAAAAQSQPPPHPGPIKAIVEKFDNPTLAVKTDQGKELSVTVPAAVRVTRARQVTAADIKPGQFIHSMTVEGPDGKLLAQEIYILPDAMRPAGEGHFPRPNLPKGTMTNGNIEEVAGPAGRRVIKVSYKGGQSEIQIPQDVKVTGTELTSAAALKPGTEISLFAQESPPGTWTAFYISIP